MPAETGLKLNLGAGTQRLAGFVNVDYSPECQPDIVMDLEQVPWDFADDSVSHIVMSHVLEHLGQTPRAFLAIMQELYRICRNDAVIEITVPHPFHDNFVSDPTHVRPITPMTLALFNREENLRWRASGASNSPLALQCGVDFRVVEFQNRLEPPAMDALKQLEERDMMLAQGFFNFGRNLISEMWFKVKVVKPAG
jgi:hypothetical protein